MTGKENCFVKLEKQNFVDFFKKLSKKYKIFGPSSKNSNDSFIEIDSSEKIKFDNKNTKISPKGFLLPQTEILFSFNSVSNKVEQEETENKTQEKNKLLFGVRPCDTLAISYLDKVFLENEPVDPYYLDRRKSIGIVSFACTNPDSTCFCTSVGCGPDSENGADIIFFELNNCYLIKKITPQGEKILENAKEILKPAKKSDIYEKETLMKKVNDKLKKFFEINDLINHIEKFDASYWDYLHKKCLGCGICTFLCPTCHCFDITDEVIGEQGMRVRTWDSCMFPLFTLHASGHNPRPTHKERVRQRILHKFSYAPKYYGETFCVGCGRCIIYCPVNMDIRQMFKEILEE